MVRLLRLRHSGQKTEGVMFCKAAGEGVMATFKVSGTNTIQSA